MPSFGADMDDGVLVQWRMEPGQAVRRGEVVAVVETQKGAIDVEVWQDGTAARLVAQPGQRLPVGDVLAVLASPDEAWQGVAARAAEAAAAPGPPRPAAAPTPVSAPVPAPAPALAAAPARVSPAARKRAAELGLDLGKLVPAQPGAPISLADVERAAAAAAPVDAAAAMRAAIAAAMTRSKREIPHYYLGCELSVEAAHRWLEDFNAQRPITERVLFAALALRAVALALREAPALNGRFQAGRFEPAPAIHLGVVTALRGGGLVVPTVHDADRLALPQLMAALREVLSRARGGRLRSSDLADSTITVSNLGDLGVDTVYGVIYPPQVALVGLGRVQRRPVVREDGIIAAERTLNVTLSADHRASDALAGAGFLAALRERLAHPETTP
ncbi:2-oxo acid dehydrogenase subunit E2 [Azohydromonas caseinilytica]|nr:2-oxo acid dehydrogenase subunit E2 [Azohydromonas caseinilytica]